MELGVSYIPHHDPSHLECDMKYLKEIGCTEVLFALQENHFHWLTGAVRFGAKIARDNGLNPRAVIWGYANTCGGGLSSHVMLKNHDMWRCDEYGVPYMEDSGPKACYNNPKNILHYCEYIEEAWNTGFTGFMIDEPCEQTCFCTHCREKFFHKFHKNLTDSIKTQEYQLFQDSTVYDYVRKCAESVKAINQGIRLAVCIMPQDKKFFSEIVKVPQIDVFATDPYWLRPINNLTFENAVEVSLNAKTLAHAKNKQFELYLGCFGIAGGLGLEEKIYSEGWDLVKKSSPDVLTTWSFRGGRGLGRKDSEECDNPELAWENVVKLYTKLSE